MKILWLGPQRNELFLAIESHGDTIIHFEEPISEDDKILCNIDFIMSYGYRHILKREILDRFYRRAINLHISYLPWNRGADPNIWSIIDDTPKGVTIHYIDEGIDTGDIILQKRVEFSINETLKTSYEKLSNEIEKLLVDNWYSIRKENIKAYPQEKNSGSIHYKRDAKLFTPFLSQGWDTLVIDIIHKWKESNQSEKSDNDKR